MDNCAHFYLGANSPSGFASLYESFTDPDKDEKLYILKGGPGCGKSSFMRVISGKLSAAGHTPEYIHCSGDPDSLDGLWFEDLKVGIVDGTSPHSMEAVYPGSAQLYINLGMFYDDDALRPLCPDIARLTKAYKSAYEDAYSCIAAARGIVSGALSDIREGAQLKAVENEAVEIAAELKACLRPGRDRHRFLDVLTHRGFDLRTDTVEALAKNICVIDDPGGLAPILLKKLSELCRGSGIVICHDPMEPTEIKHLLFPDASFALISGVQQKDICQKADMYICLSCFYPGGKAETAEHRRELARPLLREGVDCLKRAKELHDELEAIYNPHVDFDGVYALACAYAETLSAQSGNRQ
ncbi:MAG: hypothetical protein IJG63_03310 [Oscillospiraceae bacterium]|nr:hypothetical protein [Oscillospiraceae bacterium]